jgi:hyperosmotically inducible protein
MNHLSSARYALLQGKLLLKAVVLTGLAVVLGVALSDANAAMDVSDTPRMTDSAPHKTGHVMSDSWITTKVKSEILKSSLTKGFDVKVITMHGIVTLSGTLATAEAVDQVKAVAMKVKGVRGVDASPVTVATK